MRHVAGPGPAAPAERVVHVREPFGGGSGGARGNVAGWAGEGAQRRRLMLWGVAALLVLGLLGAAVVPGHAGGEGSRRKLLLGPSMSMGPFWFLPILGQFLLAPVTVLVQQGPAALAEDLFADVMYSCF